MHSVSPGRAPSALALAAATAFMAIAAMTGAEAQTREGIACAVMDEELADLGYAYFRSLRESEDKLARLASLVERLQRLIEQNQSDARSFVDQADDGFVYSLGFAVAGRNVLSMQAEIASARAEADAVLVALEAERQLLLTVMAATEKICAAEATGQTVDTADAADAAADDAGARPGGAWGDATLRVGFWHSDNDDYAYSDGSTLYRIDDGSVRIRLSCGGFGENLVGRQGRLCTGSWHERDGTRGGPYEGVLFVRQADDQLRLEGFYGIGAEPVRFGRNFAHVSDEEAAERRLSYPPN